MKSKRTKACDISQKVKKNVWERDEHRCIFCGNPNAMPNAHYISRAKGGLGIPQNIITACQSCHHKMDNSTERKYYLEKAKKYLMKCYSEWDEKDLYYEKNQLYR